MSYEIDICNRQDSVPVVIQALHTALLRTLELEQVASAVLSVSIVSNDEIHVLNRDHLEHDYATDVISFQLDFSSDGERAMVDAGADTDEEFLADAMDADAMDEESEEESEAEIAEASRSVASVGCDLRAVGAFIEGEIVVSAEMAETMAPDGHWSTQDELTLYVVHGLLHICGYDDLTDSEKLVMRSRERLIMASLGLKAVYAEDTEH